MLCPGYKCGGKTKVTDSILDPSTSLVVLRRRRCQTCGIKFDTSEIIESVLPSDAPLSRPEKALSQKMQKVRQRRAQASEERGNNGD